MRNIERLRRKWLHLQIQEEDYNRRIEAELYACRLTVDLAQRKLHDGNRELFERKLEEVQKESDSVLEELERLGVSINRSEAAEIHKASPVHSEGIPFTAGEAFEANPPITLDGTVISLIGRVFGEEYRVIRKLGVNPRGTVYLAAHIDTDLPYAVRVLHVLSDEFVQQFLAASEQQRILSSGNSSILPVYESGVDGDIAYAVMKYASNGTLADKIRTDALDPDSAIRVLEKAAAALDYAHKSEVLHLDVAPTNILIEGDRVYLSDFGLALLAPWFEGVTSVEKTVYGRPLYMAPEQGGGKIDLTPTSDIYAFGVVAYELITGQPPFQSEIPLRLIALHLNEDLPPHDKLSRQTYAVIRRACAKQPEERFETAQEFVKELKDALQREGQLSSVKSKNRASWQMPVRPAATPIRLTRYDFSPLLAERLSFEPEWCEVSAGNFLMGSDLVVDSLALAVEIPQTTVCIPYNYLIAKTPITNAEWLAFAIKSKVYYNSNVPGDFPAAGVSWVDAVAYCEWLTSQLKKNYALPEDLEARLPTEAEWEKAARGTDGRIYPWGNLWQVGLCNSAELQMSEPSDRGLLGLTAVGQYSPRGDSPFGLQDCGGNVAEWVLSLWRNYPYADDERNNRALRGKRVIRGGGHNSDKRYVRCAARISCHTQYRTVFTGFRVVIAPKIESN